MFQNKNPSYLSSTGQFFPSNEAKNFHAELEGTTNFIAALIQGIMDTGNHGYFDHFMSQYPKAVK